MKDRLIHRLSKAETYQPIVRYLHTIRFLNVSLFIILKVFYYRFFQKNLHQQASAVAFSFTLSIFPAILFLFTLLPYFPIPDMKEQTFNFLHYILPGDIYQFVYSTIDDILQRRRGDLLSFGFLFALYFSTSGVIDLMDTFNENCDFSEKRNFLKKRLIAFGIAFLFAVMLFFSIFFLFVGQWILNTLKNYHLLEEGIIFYLLFMLRYVILCFIFLFGISLLYQIAPAVKAKWHFFSVGSLLTTAVIIVGTELFSYYLTYFATYNRLYGSIGTILALMFWLYLIAWTLLIGFEINVSIVRARKEEKDERFKML
jgi:membrane protein